MDLEEMNQQVDMRDIQLDGYVWLQKKYDLRLLTHSLFKAENRKFFQSFKRSSSSKISLKSIFGVILISPRKICVFVRYHFPQITQRFLWLYLCMILRFISHYFAYKSIQFSKWFHLLRLICRFYWPIFIIFGLILPLNAPLEYWDESMTETILIAGLLRFAITANASWLVNSARLIWSMQQQKLMLFSDTCSLLYKLFVKMPGSHGTVVIDGDGVHVK